MKRKLAVSAALAFLLCNVLGQAQVAPATIVAVKTPGGTVNAVAKFTAKNIIANSAISESGGNVTVPGNITARQGMSGLNMNATDTVSAVMLYSRARSLPQPSTPPAISVPEARLRRLRLTPETSSRVASAPRAPVPLGASLKLETSPVRKGASTGFRQRLSLRQTTITTQPYN